MTAGTSVSAGRDGHQHAHCAGNNHGLEERQPGEAEDAAPAMVNPEARIMRDTGDWRCSRPFRGPRRRGGPRDIARMRKIACSSVTAAMASATRMLMGEARQTDQAEVGQRHHPTHVRQTDPHHHQDEDDRRDRPVDQQQHDRDHHHGHQRHLDGGVIAGGQVGRHRRRAGEEDLCRPAAASLAMMLRTASTDWLASNSPWLPARFSWT